MNQSELNRRRTFGIISHPDAGKTTLTEKLLLFGGAIHTAGAVKSNKIRKTATSDFMEIEKQRGISVATSVMGFEYGGYKVNILDTPGHKDFAEDTYRTLTAVDSVILVIDCAKGVEEQTRKLMDVCRMRSTPVIVFINKMDREGRDPFSLLDELERELGIHTRPLTWPIGMGSRFQGVYNLHENTLELFSPNETGISDSLVAVNDLASPLLDEHLGETSAARLREDITLIEGAYEPFDEGHYRSAYLAPVFFGSALNNFGVKELLDTFVALAPPPQPRQTTTREVQPAENTFSGFVFKIHANLDPNHRNRMAFCRVCSGTFKRNSYYYHTRLNKELRFTNPTSFMANEKSVIEEAWPGDVVGLYDTGTFKIGDTLTEGEQFSFRGIPRFSPEIFRQLINRNPFKAKQIDKGIRQLTDEGVAQLFIQQHGHTKIVGAVGEMQFEVIKFRLLHEYGADCDLRPMNIYKAFWFTSANREQLRRFLSLQDHHIAYDKDDHPVYLAEGTWSIKSAREMFPEIEFHLTSEFKTDTDVVQSISQWGKS
ncbi:MAG: peptide chain release factor 3 [Ignavibacteriales bacterium]|nr:peptide chain release factor 3 [Ignavibacteriales bacterium]